MGASIDMASDTAGDGNRGLATAYGWRDFGDRHRAGWALTESGVNIPSFFNDTHVGSNNFLKEFVRTGDQRWFQIADIGTQHFMDLDVAHGPRAGYRASGGLPQPAGEIHAIAHDNIDHQQRNMHYGHAHVSGLSDMYFLTGDKRSYEVLGTIANWWKFMAPYSFPLPFAWGDAYREAERDFGWPLYVMNEWVRVTADHDYHRTAAGQLANYMIQWWQTPCDHIGYNPSTNAFSAAVTGRNDATQGTGWWTMTRMDNSYGYDSSASTNCAVAANQKGANGTNPWMAGALISNLIKVREQEEQFVAAGRARVVDRTNMVNMLLQTMDYVVKYGYDNTAKYFVYSEVTRSYSGGENHLLYPLAYLDRLYKQEVAASRTPIMRSDTTRAQWLPIATASYDAIRTAGSHDTQSYGFYGYELIYPADFHKVMADTLGR
jgi:hypothetical protein